MWLMAANWAAASHWPMAAFIKVCQALACVLRVHLLTSTVSDSISGQCETACIGPRAYSKKHMILRGRQLDSSSSLPHGGRYQSMSSPLGLSPQYAVRSGAKSCVYSEVYQRYTYAILYTASIEAVQGSMPWQKAASRKPICQGMPVTILCVYYTVITKLRRGK